jgi:DNA-binding IclR family transcriptional regulator
VGESLSGVGVVDKTVAILAALAAGPLSLTELTEAVAIPRATAHRLAVALESHQMLSRDQSGRFVLGSRVRELGVAADRGRRDLVEVAAPVLAALRDRTGESSQLYVVAGEVRVCVAVAESPHGLRTIVAVGASLPMDRGSAARVLAGSDDATRRRGWAQSVEEREPGVASVSAPVMVGGEIVAAVSVSGPLPRTTRQPGRRYAPAVVDAARAIEAALR